MKAKTLTLKEESREVDLAAIDSGRETFIAEVKGLSIKDEDSFALAGAYLVEIRKRTKAIDAIFDPLIEEQKEIKRQVEAARKNIAETKDKIAAPFLELETKLKAARAAYEREQERRRKEAEEELRKAQEEALLAAAIESGDEGILDAPAIVVPEPARPNTAGIYVVRSWTYRASGEQLDEAYTKIDEYGFTVPDHAKIKSVVTALKGDTSIRGVSAYEVKDERVRISA